MPEAPNTAQAQDILVNDHLAWFGLNDFSVIYSDYMKFFKNISNMFDMFLRV